MPDGSFCPNCNFTYPTLSDKCPKCGTPLELASIGQKIYTEKDSGPEFYFSTFSLLSPIRRYLSFAIPVLIYLVIMVFLSKFWYGLLAISPLCISLFAKSIIFRIKYPSIKVKWLKITKDAVIIKKMDGEEKTYPPSSIQKLIWHLKSTLLYKKQKVFSQYNLCVKLNSNAGFQIEGLFLSDEDRQVIGNAYTKIPEMGYQCGNEKFSWIDLVFLVIPIVPFLDFF